MTQAQHAAEPGGGVDQSGRQVHAFTAALGERPRGGGDDEAAYGAASAAAMVMVREGYYLVHRSGPFKKQ